jgi:hypothetical protein
MGLMLLRALNEAGLGDIAEQALGGKPLSTADLERLRAADLLLVSGLADAVRAKFHGDDVRIYANAAALRGSGAALLELALDPEGTTGAELLVGIALARLSVPAHVSLGVSFEAVGLQLAQTALVFGADVLCGDLSGKRTLPLLDGAEARRKELGGLLERAGRHVVFVEARQEVPEQEMQEQLA